LKNLKNEEEEEEVEEAKLLEEPRAKSPRQNPVFRGACACGWGWG
jgi:hypothetical protein